MQSHAGKLESLCLWGFLAFAANAFTQTLTPNLPVRPIGANDLIAVSVYDAPELTRTVRVGADGSLEMPMVSRPIKADGLMPRDLGLAIATALEAEHLIVGPFVTVTVVEYNSHPISVAGAVKTALTFQASGPITLLEAVTRAGGLSPEAGPEILISRPLPEPGSIQHIPVKGLIDRADPELNITLTGGEEIRVPEAGKIFVLGNVRRPGAFRLADGTESTILEVLALSEGLAPFAAKEAYIYRPETAGHKTEIPIQLSRIMDRRSPDLPLLAGDILYIPDNKGRRLTIGALEKILTFGTTAGATALVYGQVR
ncbi:MAG: SLBB domain-containing protein [Bryobacteraceae bacterium]